MDYYVLRKGATAPEGPYPEHRLREEFLNGVFRPDDLAAPVGAASESAWQPVESILGPLPSAGSESPPALPDETPPPMPSASRSPATEAPAAPAPPPESSAAGKGCAIGCALVLGIGFALLVAGYIVLMHTPVPFRQFARALEQEEDMQFEGIEGSLATGIEIEKVSFPPVDGKRPEVHGVKVRYSGFWDLVRGRVIFEEVTVASARLYGSGPLRGFAGLSRNDFEWDEQIEIDENALVRVESLEIKDVVYEDTLSGELTRFDLFRWKDFEARATRFDLGEWTIQSDWLDVVTVPAEPIERNGLQWTPARRYEAVLKQAGHEALRREIPLTLAIRADALPSVQWYVGAFDQKLERYSLSARQEVWHGENLDLNEWLEVEELVLPKIADLHVETRSAPGGSGLELVQVESGRFALGETTFVLDEGAFDPRETKEIVARGEVSVGGQATDVVIAFVDLPGSGSRYGWECRLRSEPPADQEALLAAVLFAKSPEALTDSERVALGVTERLYFERPILSPDQPMNEVELPPLPPVERSL